MEVSYSGPRMKGFTSTFQQWSIPPLSSNQYWAPNDVIKIMGNISDGLIDPYRSHIEFEVETMVDWQPVGLIQIDHSAQSFISQTVLLSNQVQVERIQQYDTLAAVLTDIGFSQYVCESRSGEGLGYSNLPTGGSGTFATGRPSSETVSLGSMPAGNPIQEYNMGGGFSPTLAPQFCGNGYLAQMDSSNTSTTAAAFANTILSGTAGGVVNSTTNWLVYPETGTNYAVPGSGPNIYTSQAGRAMNVRSQYLLGPLMNGYPDGPMSLPLSSPQVKNQAWNYSNMTTNGFNPNNPYQTTYSNNPPAVNNFLSLNTQPCGVSGYTKPYTSEFSPGTNQPFISATIPQVQMVNGALLPQPIPISRKTFRIPLISAIIGILIPPDQFQLIPAGSLRNFLLQITLSPYACFTSGYSDIHQFDSVGMQPSNMQKRRWQINNFQWVWHLYTFQNSQIQAAIKAKLYEGISISVNYWALSAQYQLPNGSYVRNNFQIPVNVDSLAEVCIVFLSNQYQTKSFCRKQFRLSNCVTALQFKANGMWFPLQPILGNAGNPEAVDTSGDNWNFYQLLLLSNNFLFSTNSPIPKINQKNFAINGRCYNSSNSATYLPTNLYNLAPSTVGGLCSQLNGFSPTTMNCQTALGQSWFHENRWVGKAVYTYTFQPYGHSKGLITGLKTRDFRQFDVIFNNSPYNVYPNDQTLYIFTRANGVVKFTEEGITVLGV